MAWNDSPPSKEEIEALDGRSKLTKRWDEDPPPEKVSQLESGLRGAAQGASLGFADELTGGLEAAKDWITNDPSGFMENYKKHRDESRVNYKAAEAANPKTYLGGQLGGSVPTLFVPGLGAAEAGTGLASIIGRGALQGGAMGLGASEGENASDLARDTAIGATVGGATGAVGEEVLGPVISGVGNLAESFGNKLGNTAERLAARGIGAERNTIKKLGDEKVREAGRFALDNGVVTAGASTEDMIARNEAIRKEAGTQMENVYNKIDESGALNFNPLDAAVKVEDKVGDFWRSPINRGETKQLENTLESILVRGRGADKNISLSEAQTLKQELGKVANWQNKLTITDKEKMARDAYGVVSDSIDEAVNKGADQVGVSGLKDALSEAKNYYSKTKTSGELLENKLAREHGNRLLSLSDSAVAGGALAANPLSWTAAAALGAKKVGERYGVNTSAVLADKLSDVVSKAPQALGKFARPLQAAASRGGSSLGATHFILMQTNPEYRKLMLESGEDKEE